MTTKRELAEIEMLLTGKAKRKTKATKVDLVPEHVTPMVVQSSQSPTAARKSWPFATMKKGEWFAVKNEDDYQRARCSASAYWKRKGRRFTCIVDKELGYMVVTRTL